MSMPTSQPDASPTAAMDMSMSTPSCGDSTTMPTAQLLYQDDFKNPDSGWPKNDQFDNYFIGYHEPDWYHIEISSANQTVPVFIPKMSFGNTTIELQVFANSKKTSPMGDFRYGLVFRRSGDQYYAFAISPRTKKWYVLKSSPTEFVSLKEGTDDTIHDLDGTDVLRVDTQGSNFFFHINDHLVGQVTDSDYPKGEIGLYAETLDSTHIHIHFDALTVRDFESPPSSEHVLYQDDFTNPCTGWPIKTFDNYFIGYHEPQWYFVEIRTANSKIPIINPNAKIFGDDITVELQVLTDSPNTAPTGDFRYGLVFRRSGDQYYAFAVSPRAKKWYVLKRSPKGLEVLQQGVAEGLKGLTADDLLRVDTQGPNFFFHINDQLVGEVSDIAYKTGEVGLYTETIDSPHIRVHFDALTIRDLQLDLTCNITGGTFNVRTGPGKSFPQVAVLSAGAPLQPTGVSANREWIQIKLQDSNDLGWVSFSEGFMSCTPSLDLFPIVNP
jgi:hypothetical protein